MTAAFEAERIHREQREDQQRVLDLELQQARYDAGIAERRYAACDPDNRLIAAQLEKNWETALRRLRGLEARRPIEEQADVKVDPNAFIQLAENLSAAWHAPGLTMRGRQQLLRTLITDIIVDVDDGMRDVVLTIHWRGGQHWSCAYASHRLGNTAARRPKMRWRSCAAWPAAGLMNISPRRSIAWACQPARAKRGRRTVSCQCDVCGESTPIDLRRKMAHGLP